MLYIVSSVMFQANALFHKILCAIVRPHTKYMQMGKWHKWQTHTHTHPPTHTYTHTYIYVSTNVVGNRASIMMAMQLSINFSYTYICILVR